MDLLGNDISIDDIKGVPDDTEFRLESIMAEYGENGRPSSGRPSQRPQREERPAPEFHFPERPAFAHGSPFGDAEPEPEATPTPEDVSTPFFIQATPPAPKEDPVKEKRKPWDIPPEPEIPEEKNPYAAGFESGFGGLYGEYGVSSAGSDSGTLSNEAESPSPFSEWESDAYSLSSRELDGFDEGEHPPAPEDVPDDDVKIYSIGEETEPPAPDDAREEGRNFGSPHRDYGLFNSAGKGNDAAAAAPNPIKTAEEMDTPRRGNFLTAPFIALAALFAIKRQQSLSGASIPDADEEDLGPEPSAEKAYKYYAGNLNALKRRLIPAFIMGILLAWIAFELPTFGALKGHYQIRAVVCLILELSILVMGLDVFSAGLTSLFRGRPSMWTLASVSCVASILDTAVSIALGLDNGLPFCAVSGLSMVFALWGSMLTCRGLRRSMKAMAIGRDPYAVTAESAVTDDGVTLLKSKRGTAGFIRRCEEPDCTEEAFSLLAPVLLIASLLLSAVACLVTKAWEEYFRVFSALTAAGAPFGAYLAFPMPFSTISRSLFHSGAAVAGWAGLRDIGASRHLIVTDRDIFPSGTVSMDAVRILEGTYPDKVISYAGSIMLASGSDLAPIFSDLMERNGCTAQTVDGFRCHEGGGLTAMINGEEVLCGNAGFMRLMSIRLPQRMTSGSSVFISINGVLSGVFAIKYTAVTSVQKALINLLHTRREPIFAVRDFLVTPSMISAKFEMPSDTFDFPSFAKRYDISAAEPSPESQISAILSREGLGPLVEVSDKGRRLRSIIRLCSTLSVMCAIAGTGLMFFLALTGALDSSAVKSLITYMLVFTAPVALLSLSLGR